MVLDSPFDGQVQCPFGKTTNDDFQCAYVNLGFKLAVQGMRNPDETLQEAIMSSLAPSLATFDLCGTSGVCWIVTVNAREYVGHGFACQLGVVMRLQVHPALRIDTKKCCQSQRGIGRYGTLPGTDQSNAPLRYTNLFCQSILADPHGLQKILKQDFSGVRQWNVAFVVAPLRVTSRPVASATDRSRAYRSAMNARPL